MKLIKARIPAKDYIKLKAAAKKRNVHMSDIIREAIKDTIGK